MCELRRHVHPAVAAGRHRTLPVQRLRPLPQDERPEQTSHQAQAQTGESRPKAIREREWGRTHRPPQSECAV